MVHALAWDDLELGGRLGEGHSGTVFQARLIRSASGMPEGAVVAVKRYKSWVWDEPGQLERIFREVDIGRKIQHPNLVTVVGAVLDKDGRPALVMKFHEGITLQAYLHDMRERNELAPLDLAISYLRGIAAGLATLHQHGVTHRDVKPANVILSPTGPILADLGVLRSRDFAEQTTTGAFLGTVRYAAPEYLFGEEYDHRIDVYAFGAIAYELLTGQEHYGRYQHWARVVAAKMKPARGIESAELQTVASRASLGLTCFFKCLLEHSRCAAKDRDLNLSSVVEAVDRAQWNTRLTIESGCFVTSQGLHDDQFGTADAAAIVVRTMLSTEEIDELHDVLRAHGWQDWVSTINVPTVLHAKLPKLALVHVHNAKKGDRVQFAPSVVEAAIKGLF